MAKSIYFYPIGPRILVARDNPTVHSGLKVSDELTREKYPDIGTVLAIGDVVDPEQEKMHDQIKAIGVEVGARVCFTRYSPVAIRNDDLEHLFVNFEDVLGIVRENK